MSNTGWQHPAGTVHEAVGLWVEVLGGEQMRVELQLDPEKVQRVLKGIVSQKWDATGCHDHASLWKMVSMVDFFLPFLPLEQSHLRRLFDIRLHALAADLLQTQHAQLTWAPDVITFLCNKVGQSGLPDPHASFLLPDCSLLVVHPGCPQTQTFGKYISCNCESALMIKAVRSKLPRYSMRFSTGVVTL